MSIRSALRTLAFVSLACAAACNDPASPTPDGLQGTYVLRGVGDAPLPVTYGDAGGGGTFSLVADTIHLDGRGRVDRRTVVHRTAGAFGPAETMSLTRALEYMRSGSVIEIGYFGPCNDTFVCVANDVGEMTAIGFELRLSVMGEPRMAQYERIAEGEL